MHSTELPVTEWWDPADDVYDVPPCPQGDGYTDADLWTEAFLFSATIGWIWADYDGYWGRWTRQLTTGECPEDCEYHPGDYEIGIAESTLHAPACPQANLVCCECWIVRGPLGEPTELEQNPDCPLHWCPSWLAPCSCEYALHPVIWYPTHLIDVPGVGQRGAAYTFRIDPDCRHHGGGCICPPHLDGVGREKWPTCPMHSSWPYVAVLDEDERRGH